MKNSTRLTVLCLSAVFSVVLTSALGDSRCKTEFTRVLGRTNTYVWTCDCPSTGGTVAYDIVGRVQGDAPEGPQNSAAQASATTRCAQHAKPEITDACNLNATIFEHIATEKLRTCLQVRPSKDDLKEKGRFRFSRKLCRSQFVPFLSRKVGGVWLCLCDQPTFQVVSGRAQFLTNAAPTSPREEVRIISSCTIGVKDQLEDVCRNAPGDFELLALQLLQVCCKRARVFSNAKFQCAAAVPDDATPLKVSFNF